MYLGRFHILWFLPLQIIQTPKFLPYRQTTCKPAQVPSLPSAEPHLQILSPFKTLWRPSEELNWKLLKIIGNLEKQLK